TSTLVHNDYHPPTFHHRSDSEPHPPSHPVQVDVDHAVPVLLGHLAGGPRDGDTGVIAHHVEASVAPHGLTYERLDVRRRPNVGAECERVAAGVRDGRGHALRAVLVHVADAHARALRRERLRDGAPDPPRPAPAPRHL